MNRVKIELPAKLPFSTTIPIRITDINYGNHVGNQVFLTLIHEARVRFLRQFGYQELDMEGVSLIMADAAIEFNAEVLYGDEIEVEVGAGAFSRVGFDLLYRLSAFRNNEKFLAGKAKTGMICFNYNLKKVVGLPDPARINLKAEPGQ